MSSQSLQKKRNQNNWLMVQTFPRCFCGLAMAKFEVVSSPFPFSVVDKSNRHVIAHSHFCCTKEEEKEYFLSVHMFRSCYNNWKTLHVFPSETNISIFPFPS